MMRGFDYSQLTKMSWPMDILNLVAKIREYKGRQELFVRQKPMELKRLIEIAKIQSTEASNKIEGIVTTSTRIKQLMADKTVPRNRDEDEIMGYRDVLKTIHESYEYIPVKASYILQLHRDLYTYSARGYAGQFKNIQNYITETRADGSSLIRFTPVPPSETPSAMDLLCKTYEEALAYELIDPLILIPVFISDFLCIHPFNDGNGRMSRLLTLLLLYKSEFMVGKYISIEKEIEKTKDMYYESLVAIDEGWHEGENDPIPFIRYMLQIILSCYKRFEERVNMIHFAGHKSQAYDIVRSYVETKLGRFTSAEVIVNCPRLSRSSVLQAMKTLTEEGIIQRFGSGRATYYVTIHT